MNRTTPIRLAMVRGLYYYSLFMLGVGLGFANYSLLRPDDVPDWLAPAGAGIGLPALLLVLLTAPRWNKWWEER